MTKTLIALGLGLAALLGLSGCFDDSSTEAALATAYDGATKGHLWEFKGILSGNALKEFGSKDGMLAIQNDLKGMDVKFGDKTTLWVKKYWWVRTDYVNRVDILVKSPTAASWSRYKTADVFCEWRREHLDEITNCVITDLN